MSTLPENCDESFVIAIARSADDELVVHHGLGLACVGNAKVEMLHARYGDDDEEVLLDPWRVLSRWGMAELADQHKVHNFNAHGDPADDVLAHLRIVKPNLIVVGTRARRGLSRLLVGSVAEALASETRVDTLFVPDDARPMVDADDGTLSLRSVVIPVGSQEATSVALDALQRLAGRTSTDKLQVHLVHAGRRDLLSNIVFPEGATWERFDHEVRGAVAESVCREAEERNADLIITATEGHYDARDILLGTRSERMIHRATVPVLEVHIPIAS